MKYLRLFGVVKMLHKIKTSLRIIITILITSGGIFSSTIASDMPSKTLIVVGSSELIVAFLLALVLDRISNYEKIKVRLQKKG